MPKTLHSERLSPKTYIQNVSHRNERLTPKIKVSLRNFQEESSRYVFLSFCLVSGRDPRVCGNVHGKGEIPQSTRHGHGRGHGHGRAAEGKGATGRETRRSEKAHARAENAQTASYDGNDGVRRFSCPQNEERTARRLRSVMGGTTSGERIQLRGRPRAHRRPPVPIGDAHGLRLVRGDPGRGLKPQRVLPRAVRTRSSGRPGGSATAKGSARSWPGGM